MKRFPAVLFLLGSGAASAAECLQVSGEHVELSPTDFGGAAIHWQAEIRNRCDDAEFDADLTVHLLDADGESIYQIGELVMLGFGETRQIKKKVYVPSSTAEQVEGIDVEVEERRRPM